MNKIIKGALFVSGIFMFLGILTVAIIVAGFFIGLVLSVLFPVALVFTGLGLLWLGFKDFDQEDPDKKE